MAKKSDKKTCFVVSPIGSAGSPERIHADWLLEGIIKPVFEAHFTDYAVVRADKMPAPGMIDSQIIEQLLDADLVIADITTLNPNVFYEIGIRHVMRKPIVHMVLDGSPIPFDIKIFKHLGFSLTTPQDLEEAKRGLKEALESVHDEDFKVDNPVTRTRAKIEFTETATPAQQMMEQQIDDLRSRVLAVERRSTLAAVAAPTFAGVPAHRPPLINNLARYAGGGASYPIGEITFQVKVLNGGHRNTLIKAKKSLSTYFPQYNVGDIDVNSHAFVVSVDENESNRQHLMDYMAEFNIGGCAVSVLYPN